MDLQMMATSITGLFAVLTAVILGLSGLLQLIGRMLNELTQVMDELAELRRAAHTTGGSRKRPMTQHKH